MSYSYSQLNRFEKPCDYMYSKFEGVSLLMSYHSSRMAIIDRYSKNEQPEISNTELSFVNRAISVLFNNIIEISEDAGRHFQNMCFEYCDIQDCDTAYALNDDCTFENRLNEISAKNKIITKDLLSGMIFILLTDMEHKNFRYWLERIIQKFEVTKKIYEYYDPDFRKGQGKFTLPRLYWLLSLVLALSYAQTKNLKYLNTMLKLCDLLCSLREDQLIKAIPRNGLLVVLFVEIVCVRHLEDSKGISIDSG